jgi:hypothetical protein
VAEELQFVTSQIDRSSKKKSGKKKIKTEVPPYDFKVPPNISPQRSKFLFETSIHSRNSKTKIGLTGKAGTRTSGEMRKSTSSTGLSTSRSKRNSSSKDELHVQEEG